MSKVGRPKGYSPSPETRAKISAALRSRENQREQALKALELARQSPKAGKRGPARRKKKPQPRTPECQLFEKIRKICGSAAAYAEIGRGV